jgi:hypothetical protein
MIDGLTAAHTLAASPAAAGRTLPAAEVCSSGLFCLVQHRFAKLAPMAYRGYLQAWRRRTLHRARRFHARPLTFYQWRTRGLAPGAATSLHGEPVPMHRDGLIDAFHLAVVLLRPGDLDGEGFADALLEYLDAFWPEDYRRYRYRYAQAVRAQRTQSPDRFALPSTGGSLPARLDYYAWSTAVRILQHTPRCSTVRIAALRRLLILTPGDLTPTFAWQPPPKLVELPAW